VAQVAAVLRERLHEAHDPLVAQLAPVRELELRPPPVVLEFPGEDLRLRVGEDPVAACLRLLDDEGEPRLADGVGVEEAGDCADVEVHRRDADELLFLVVDGRGERDPRHRPVAAAQGAPLGPDRPPGIAGRGVPLRLPPLAGQPELPALIGLSLRVVLRIEIEDHRLAGLSVVAGLADAEPALREPLDGQHEAVLEARRKEGEMALCLHDPLQVAGEPLERLRGGLDGPQELAVHLALVQGAFEQRAHPVPDPQGAFVEQLRGEGVGVPLEVVIG